MELALALDPGDRKNSQSTVWMPRRDAVFEMEFGYLSSVLGHDLWEEGNTDHCGGQRRHCHQ